MIRVAVADDQELVREAFAALLAAEDDIEVVGEAATGAEAVELAHARRPDVVVMDIRMPDLDGIEATRRITADPRLTAVRVLVLTTFDLDRYVYDALRAGASGFLLKDVTPRRLLDALAVVAARDALIAPSVTRRLIAEFATRPDPVADDGLVRLTERERDVLVHVARGRSNHEVGAALHMSPLTAKTHVSRILTKLGARDRAQLVVRAYESGLVRPGDADESEELGPP